MLTRKTSLLLIPLVICGTGLGYVGADGDGICDNCGLYGTGLGTGTGRQARGQGRMGRH